MQDVAREAIAVTSSASSERLKAAMRDRSLAEDAELLDRLSCGSWSDRLPRLSRT